ncbi:cytochrome C assembly family protein [Isoalcanivorax indicus]|uniref:cytochrome C assembly family protein n=1 Tax=Isoalcanivorax indicus TaxID=2202653 RepID=UPI000DB9A15C|nr:cytochrome c biogenesis protein CcsA [Isoalcanivorax indicus]
MGTATWAGLAAMTLYLVASVVVLRRLRGAATDNRRLLLVLGLAAVTLHALCLWLTIVTTDGVHLGLFPMASMVTGTGAALVAVTSLYRRIEWVSALVFPLSALSIPPLLWAESGYPPHPLAHGMAIHVLLSILAYAVLAIAAAQSLLLLIQHRQLKSGHIRGVMRVFPPIQVMETMLFELLWAGALLLTAAMVAGFLYVDDLLAQRVAHKTLLTLLAWALFVTLLAGRHFLGWRAVTAIRLTLAGFVLLVVAFFGSQLVIEYIVRG